MNGRIGIYIPTLGRPHALQRTIDNIAETTVTPHKVIFVCEAHDQASFVAALATGADVLFNGDRPSYSNSLQAAFDVDTSEFFIGANDDFDFQPGWDTNALEAMVPGVDVVGFHDGSPSCGFTTISLIRRSYILERSGVIDMPGRVNYPYRHNYVDTEFHATAAARGVFAAAPTAVILHKHPDWGHAELDDTYRKSQADIPADRETFESRRHLWEALSS